VNQTTKILIHVYSVSLYSSRVYLLRQVRETLLNLLKIHSHVYVFVMFLIMAMSLSENSFRALGKF